MQEAAVGHGHSAQPGSVESRSSRSSRSSREQIELEILRNSISHRARGARIAVPGMVIAVAAFSWAVADQIPQLNIALWAVPNITIILARGWVAVGASRVLETGDRETLLHYDRLFRNCSIAAQFWVGTGVWSCGGFSAETDLYMTLAICVFGTGAAVSLTHDARTVTLTIPMLFGQAILFWLLKGTDGYHIAVILIPVMLLIIGASRRSAETLDETISIRFENDALLRRLEEEKEAAITAARVADDANRSKSLFMAAASHDLRQPLYAITLLSDTLALQDLPEQATGIVEQQSRSLEVLTHMFDNLLDLSRFDSGDVQARVEPVFLPDLIADLFTEFLPLCESKGLRLETNDLEQVVLSDVDLLARLLRNLISNAVRYTDAGSVSIKAHRQGDFVTIEVSDTGCGIDLIDQQRVFQEFVQLENPERNREKGVGLGLSIVHRIADLLGHELSLSSDAETGTKVTITIPCADDAVPRQKRDRPDDPDASPIPADAYVWIVEDDRLVRDALATHFDVLEVRHDFAEDRAGLEALAELHGWPDFAVLDDMLADDETGLELARWLAANVATERILLVTGNTEPNRLKELETSGFRMLRKPVSSEDLTGWLRSGAD